MVTAFQAAAYIGYLKSPANAEAIIEAYSGFFWVSTVVVLTVGTLFVMWLGEKITDKGLGNGTSIIIMIGILARFPQAIGQEWSARIANRGAGGLLLMLVEILFLIGIIMGLIMLVQGTRKVPVEYAKQIVGNRQMGGARNFLPLKVYSFPVLRADPKITSSSSGKFRSSNTRRNSCPTAPLTPTIATFIINYFKGLKFFPHTTQNYQKKTDLLR